MKHICPSLFKVIYVIYAAVGKKRAFYAQNNRQIPRRKTETEKTPKEDQIIQLHQNYPGLINVYTVIFNRRASHF
jgi:hypothetical protein